MYTHTNFKSKAALKRAFDAGDKITVFQPGGMFPPQMNGQIALEGPHYPKPHSWYASALVTDGVVTKVLS